jgi:hypothetical protein
LRTAVRGAILAVPNDGRATMVPIASKHLSHPLHDLGRDWRSWSIWERRAAGLLVLGVLAVAALSCF